MDYKEILNDIYSRRTRGIKPGLERVEEACRQLDIKMGYKIIHVAGTNGKGSTSSIITAILKESGERVGLFTSPHIVEFRERFIVDGTPIDNGSWVEVWESIRDVCDSLELTFFELSTVMALIIFSNERCNWVVLETGLGGRLDSTNIVDPEVSVITALSVEHTEYLGDTIEEIALEKLGIVKEGRAVVVNGSNSGSILDIARGVALDHNAKLHIASPRDVIYRDESGAVQELSYLLNDFTLPLLGAFQRDNCSVALKVAEVIGVDLEVALKGVSKAFIPCRMQMIKLGSKEFLFDVAHNPQAMDTLCSSIDSSHFLIGMMADKDIYEMVKIISKKALSITAITPSIPRAQDGKKLIDIIKESGYKGSLHFEKSPEDAINRVGNLKGKRVVTGSFYTVSDILVSCSISPY